MMDFSFFLRYRDKYTFVHLGPAAPLLSPVQPGADFFDPAEVKNLLDSKRYFKGFCNKCDHTSDVANHDVALCALGCLVNHLERLMVSLRTMAYFLCVICMVLFW